MRQTTICKYISGNDLHLQFQLLLIAVENSDFKSEGLENKQQPDSSVSFSFISFNSCAYVLSYQLAAFFINFLQCI